MKRLVCHILILLLGLQANMRWLVRTTYQVNKKYIAENLCENRKRGDMKCEGKCFLEKQSKKTEKDQQEERQKGKEGAEMHCSNLTLLPKIAVAFLDQVDRDVFEETHRILVPSDIFHPPC